MRTSNPALKILFVCTRTLSALLCLGVLGLHQVVPAAVLPQQTASKQVIGSVSADSVRFSSLGELIQMRLEVVGPQGDILFESGFISGNVIDWQLVDKQSKRLADGVYLCVITVKDAFGQLTRKRAIVSLRDQSVGLKPSDRASLSSSQADAGGPEASDDGSVTIVEPGAAAMTAVLAHNGVSAQLVSGSGGLSISSGDFFANKLLEQVRLTAEGNVGIGVANPQARLDVAGTIRASQGIVFPDGTVQFSAASKTLGAKSSHGEHNSGGGQDFQAQAGGTGTQNFIAKWIDNAGTLGDSTIVESGGDVGIGTPIPQSGFDYRKTTAAFFTRDIGPVNPTLPQSVIQLGVTNVGSRNAGVGASFLFFADNSAGAKSFLGRVSGVWENPNAGAEAGAIFFQVRANSADTTASSEAMRITSRGRVGIGTSLPGSKLEVVDPSNAGLRVQTNAFGGTVASFGGNGAFNIDASGQPGGRFAVLENGRVGIGIPSGVPGFKLEVIDSSNTGLRVQNNSVGGTIASFGGTGAFNIDASGQSGGRFTVLENGKVGIGTNNPGEKLAVSGTGVVRALVNSDSNAGLRLSLNNLPKWSLATTNGDFQIFNDANPANAVFVNGTTNNVGIGTTSPQAKLTVDGGSSTGLYVAISVPNNVVAQFGENGAFLIDAAGVPGGRFEVLTDSTVRINNPPATLIDNSLRLVVNGAIKAFLPAAAGGPVCWGNPLGPNPQQLVSCSSSIRYKADVNNYSPGLNLVSRLRPVSFNWKQGGIPDMGLIAEEVAAVEPLLVFHNEKGEVEGVKYDRVSVVLLNAIKEQQAQIQTQQREIERLKSFACSLQPKSGLCKPASRASTRTRTVRVVSRTK